MRRDDRGREKEKNIEKKGEFDTERERYQD